MKERVTLTIEKDLLSQLDANVDGISVKNRSHAVELHLRKALRGAVPRKALILAGGRGTRMRPFTDSLPKPLLNIQGKPLLVHNIEFLKKYGIKDILLSVGYMKEQIKAFCGDGSTWGVNITYLEEDEPLGTAGPLHLAKEVFNESLLVMNADELKDVNLESFHQEHVRNGGLATVALTTVKDTSKFGVAMLDGNRIMRFVEKPSPEDTTSKLINAGLYILEPGVLHYLPEGYAMLETELFPKLAQESALYGYHFAGMWAAPESPEWLAKIEKEWKGFLS